MVNSAPSSTTVNILGKEYKVVCSRQDEEALLQSARYLDQNMRDIFNSGKIVNTERVAILAALNISHELLVEKQHNQQKLQIFNQVDQSISKLLSKVAAEQ